MDEAIHLKQLRFSYAGSGFALAIDELRVAKGERIAVIGESGSGKTTILQLISGILIPDSGSIEVCGTDLHSLGDAGRRAFRISRIGLVFQDFELLDYLTVVDNILLPYRINRTLRLTHGTRERAMALIDELGLGGLEMRRPHQLSHGQRQRVAVCRALVTEPELVLADEPTANLDRENRNRVLEAFDRHAHNTGSTLLISTHDDETRQSMDRTLDLAIHQPANTNASSHER